MALPVCIFTVLNLSYTFSAIIYFIKIYNRYTCMKVIVMGLVNIVLWLLLGLYPFFQVSVEFSPCLRPRLRNTKDDNSANIAGCIVDTSVRIATDVRTSSSHSTICSSQYHLGGIGLSVVVFVVTPNECQVISNAHTWKLCIFCDIMHRCRHSHSWNVFEYSARNYLGIIYAQLDGHSQYMCSTTCTSI